MAPQAAQRLGLQQRELLLPRLKKALILVGNQRIAAVLAFRLRGAGYDGILASGPMSALNLAINEAPDVIVLDVSAPSDERFKCAAHIQSVVQRTIPIVFIAATQHRCQIEKTEAIGAVAFLDEPAQNKRVIAAIREAAADLV